MARRCFCGALYEGEGECDAVDWGDDKVECDDIADEGNIDDEGDIDDEGEVECDESCS